MRRASATPTYGMGTADLKTKRGQQQPSDDAVRKQIMQHALFEGIGEGTREALLNALHQWNLKEGKRLTNHTIPDGQGTLQNWLWFPGAEGRLLVNLHVTGEHPEKKPGLLLGKKVPLSVTGISSWFGEIPALVVTAATEGQCVWRLPPLSFFYNPEKPGEGILTEDVARLLENAIRMFSGYLGGDNTKVPKMEDYRPHVLPCLPLSEMEGIRRSSRQKIYEKVLSPGAIYAPDLDPDHKEPSAFFIEGSEGYFYDRRAVMNHSGAYTKKALGRAGISPIARFGSTDGKSVSSSVFEYAGSDPSRVLASAVFIPSQKVNWIAIPLGKLDDPNSLPLRQERLRHIAKKAAKMHEHVAKESRRLETPFAQARKAFATLLGQF